jgi:hypothetical protein
MHDSCITTKIENPYDFQYLQGAPASQPRFWVLLATGGGLTLWSCCKH